MRLQAGGQGGNTAERIEAARLGDAQFCVLGMVALAGSGMAGEQDGVGDAEAGRMRAGLQQVAEGGDGKREGAAAVEGESSIEGGAAVDGVAASRQPLRQRELLQGALRLLVARDLDL